MLQDFSQPSTNIYGHYRKLLIYNGLAIDSLGIQIAPSLAGSISVKHVAPSRICLRLQVAVLGLASLAQAALVPPAVKQSAALFPREARAASTFHDPLSLKAEGRLNCAATRAAEPLATPDPLTLAFGRKVTISFIIGSDGEVHSPVVLESAGADADRTVLETIRTWRYRPARCNSAPAESEGKVEFSSR
jgi:TonB family protein